MKYYLKKSGSDSHLIMGILYDKQFPGRTEGAKGGKFVYSTGERVKLSGWDNKNDFPKKSEGSLQSRLLLIRKQATDYIRDNRTSLTRDGLKSHLDGLRPKEVIQKPEDAPKTLIELWREYLGAITGTVDGDTIRNYTNSLKIVEGFLKANKWLQITPEKFTITHYKKLAGHLNSTKLIPPRKGSKEKEGSPFSTNQQAKILKHFKSCLNHIGKLKLEIGFDTDEISYKEKPGLKLFLSEEELQAFIDADLSETDDIVRDLFVLQCSLGPRISDLKRIDQSIRGNKIVLETQKNEKIIEITIPPQVRRILEKYNYQLPKISEQKYREGIKRIYKKLFPENTVQVREGNKFRTVFVHEEISSHDAVRTFITLSAGRGMSVNSIAKITGKTVKVLISNYLSESQKIADQEMEKAWGVSPLRKVI